MQWRRQFVYILASLLLFIYLNTTPLRADERKDLEKKLETQYKGEVLTLRKFYQGNTLKFDRAGQLIGKRDVGPWTLYGKIEVRKIKVRRKKIEIHGNRIFVGYSENHSGPRFLRSRETTKIIIVHTSSDDQTIIARTAIPEIFLSGYTSLADVVPIHWKSFLSGDKQEKKKHTPESQTKITCIACGEKSVEANTTSLPTEKGTPDLPHLIMVSSEVPAAKRMHYVPPRYPKIARSYGWQGTVRLTTTIDKTGNVTNLTIDRAAGMGLDEAAIEAVRQ